MHKIFLRCLLTLALLFSVAPACLQADIFTGAGFALVDAVSQQPAGRGVAFGDIVVSNNGGTVAQFNSVSLQGLAHTFMGDLRISLTNQETNRTVVLTSPPADFSANFNGNYTFLVNANSNTIDQAAFGLPDSGDLASGSYAMSSFGGSRTNFDSLVGLPINGTWRLSVVDFFPGNTLDPGTPGPAGSVGSWSLNANITAVPEPSSFGLIALALSLISMSSNRKAMKLLGRAHSQR
jgi:subtilisin-like proprotein convertase family protein